jgi:6-phosphogluconate dehydrogenase (decarboxylating)
MPPRLHRQLNFLGSRSHALATSAIGESVPAPVHSAALYERFSSRGEGDFGDKLLSALRFQFGGHEENPLMTRKFPDDCLSF